MDPVASILIFSAILFVLASIFHQAIWVAISDHLGLWSLRHFDRQRERHPFLDNFVGHHLDEPVAALRRLEFFHSHERLSDRELARDIHRSIRRQLVTERLLHRTPDRPPNWWAVARNVDEPHLSSRDEIDLLAAAEDLERIWWEPLEQVIPGAEGYIRALSRWAEISRGTFRPSNIRESWGNDWEPVLVTFEHGGVEHLFTHLTGYNNQLDTESLRDFLNPLIASSGIQFEIVDLHHIPNIVVALTADEREYLTRERGWSFAKFPALVI